MGRFAGVKDAKHNEGGVYFEPGVFLVRVDAVKVGESRKKVEFFCVETTVLESDAPTLKRGASVSAMYMSDWDTYLGAIKNFASIAQQVEADDIDEAGIEMIVSEENPCAGTILKVVAANIKTRAGGDFTKIKWVWPEAEDFARIGYNADGTPKAKPAEQKTA